MEPNDKSSPENRQKELLDLAYNIVPEGAEYDVFSENTATEIKPALLYDDIAVNKVEKSNENTEAPQEKADDLPNNKIEYDVFSENPVTNPEPKKPVTREYLDRLYKGEVDFSETQVRMTRSDYIADYNRINEHYHKEIEKILKNCLWAAFIVAFAVFVIRFMIFLQTNLGEFIYMIFNGLKFGAITAIIVVSAFFILSTLKSIKKAKETQRKALERLEQRKEELMVLGLYDTAN